MAEKLDLKKTLKHLYTASVKEAALLEMQKMNYLMIDGEGNPNTSGAFNQALEALYATAYTLKFMVKKSPEGMDYGVMALEGLWWTDDMSEFSMEDKEHWKWTLMIVLPDFVTETWFEKAIEEVKRKKNLAAIDNVRFEGYEEGLCAQIMHVGPYAEEGPTVQKLHDFITTNGYTFGGKHHEIYLGDPRKAAPDKLKTIIRQPVVKAVE